MPTVVLGVIGTEKPCVKICPPQILFGGRMDSDALKSLGTRLVTAYYQQGLNGFKKEIRLALMWAEQFRKAPRSQKFLIIDSLLAYAENPISTSYDMTIPILHEFLRLNPEIKEAWRKTAEAFLVNRIIGSGNVPSFRVNNTDEYLLLRDDLAGLLDIIPRDNIILANAAHHFLRNKQSVPEWVVELGQFTRFQLQILKSHAPGSVLKKENYGARELQELKHVGIHVITPRTVTEDYLLYEYDWHAEI